MAAHVATTRTNVRAALAHFDGGETHLLPGSFPIESMVTEVAALRAEYPAAQVVLVRENGTEFLPWW